MNLGPARQVGCVFLPFAAGYFLSYLFRTLNGPLAGQLTHDLGLNASGLGLLTSVYFLTFAGAQLPLGAALDRFGPRRTQIALLWLAAAGAALFAIAPNVPLLILARALIGLGVSGALMAGLKAIVIWMPKKNRPVLNGAFIMCGGLGAITSTKPLDFLQGILGWREVFLVLAAVTLGVTFLIGATAPEKELQEITENWRDSARGTWAIYRDPAFWRLAPLSASIVGTAFAVHGLWAARWLADVEALSPGQVVSDLFAMGIGVTLGAAVIGLVADFLKRNGVAPSVTFALACSLFIALQLVVLDRVALPDWLLWGVIGSFGAMTVLSYSIVSELFPPEQIGRANSALNLLHLLMAFILQYGMGIVASRWPQMAPGHLPVIAYRAAFALPLSLEVAALAWFLLSHVQHARTTTATVV